MAIKLLETANYTSADDLLGQPSHQSEFWKYAIKTAEKYDASDIHIEQTNTSIEVRYRINGELAKLQGKEGEDTQVLADERERNSYMQTLKDICRLDTSKQDECQDGAISLNMTNNRYRISVVPSVFGEKYVMRIIREAELPTLNQLRLSLETVKDLQWALKQGQGVIILSGPTGSGKSTTLQAMLMGIDRKTQNVMSLEDPVERIIPNTTQVQINHKVSWAQGIRSALRQDPDVILIGEIRDKESAQLAFEASQTGHLVLTTLHANDTAGIIDRLKGLGVEDSILADNLLLASSQRLIPLLCQFCRIENTGGWSRGHGCPSCSKSSVNGLIGRTLAFEYVAKPSHKSITDFDRNHFRNNFLKTTLKMELDKMICDGIVDISEAGAFDGLEIN